jgi:hypothetical protein
MQQYRSQTDSHKNYEIKQTEVNFKTTTCQAADGPVTTGPKKYE